MDTQKQYCTNKQCKHHKLLLKGNVCIHSRKHERFRCKTCNKTWVKHIHENHYKIKTDEFKMRRGLQLINHGISIRKTAQLLKVSPSTIQRWKNRMNN